EVLTAPDMFSAVLQAIGEKNIPVENAEVTRIQTSGEPVKVQGDKAKQVMDLLEELEEHDDVTSVSSNFDFDE
ncbi:MAG TPA: YebC/PmpR family DNA-binding transcriptional regulator, partial [Spirochaetota bacterium]|nr:YebC/PmpR family DNA-binding transcriptional regulator [Spirochaetota bacterium]